MNNQWQNKRFRTAWLPLLALIALVLGAGLRQADPVRAVAVLPDGFAQSMVVDDLYHPTSMAFAPDGRLFVLLQGGQVRVVKNGVLLPTPFLTLNVNSEGARGLLGIAFDPNFATNHYIYLYYTARTPSIHHRISRFTANGDVALANSEFVLLDMDTLKTAIHNGGALHMGLDGKLYATVGDNGKPVNGQNFNTFNGKMLRLNTNGTIPTDNPYYNTASGNYRFIWAPGLRNSFTFAVQPGTGLMFANDVGASTWEEINIIEGGVNYGWPNCEGLCNPPNALYRDPIFTYMHDGSTCAVVGAVFYNPTNNQFPAEYVGDYFFTDWCEGWIKRMDPTVTPVTPIDFATGISNVTDFDVAPDGSLYYLAHSRGAVMKIEYSANPQLQITQQPTDQSVAVGQSAELTVSATGESPITYQWQRDEVDIPDATAPTYTVLAATLDDNNARFRCVVTNPQGNATSNTATLTVVEDLPPQGIITRPLVGAMYSGGIKISYAGKATDPEDGSLPGTAFTWEVNFHHADHVHPFLPAVSGRRSGSFVIPRNDETAANVWYRIILTVRDSAGVEHTSFRDILPRVVTLTVDSAPSGLQVTVDGQPQTTPYTFDSVVGIMHSIGAPTPQTLGPNTYRFKNWSDNNPSTHTIRAPRVDRTYIARFILDQ